MSEWKEYKLGDIADINMGQSPNSSFYNKIGGGIPFLQGNRTFGFKYPTFDTYTTAITKIAEQNDVIMSVRAPVGDVNITPVKMCLGRGVCGLRANNGNQEFLYYLMRYYAKELINKESGTVFGSINRNDIYNLIIKQPSNREQTQIASILSSLDDKIAVNRKICENLEAQAQALFKHWFIDFAPFKDGKFIESDSGTVYLSDISEQITDGVHNSVKDEPNSSYMLFSCKNIVGGVLNKSSFRSISKDTFDLLRKRTKLAKGDVLLSSVGTIGEIAIVEEEPVNYEFQRSVAIVKPKQNIGTYFVYNALLANKAKLQHAAHGAVQQCLFIGDLKKVEVCCFDKAKAFLYNETVKPLFEEISKLHQENLRLSTLRDTLLPKLMSGQIKV